MWDFQPEKLIEEVFDTEEVIKEEVGGTDDPAGSGWDSVGYGGSDEIIDLKLIGYECFCGESLSNENFYSDLLNNVQILIHMHCMFYYILNHSILV